MNHAISLAAALCGLGLIGFGILKYQNADQLRHNARNYLKLQKDAQIVFHENAQVLSKRYQAGEIDTGEWHKETAGISRQLQADSNQAAMDWTESLNAAHRLQNIAMISFGCGLIAIAASVFYLLSKESEQRDAS